MEAYYAGIIPYEGKFSVIFPDVPGCDTWGETPEHAFVMAIDALAGHLEALADDGDPIPVPSARSEASQKLVKEYASLELGPLPEGTVLQLVPAPDLDMRNKTISVSFRQYVLDMIDRKAQAEGMTRSGFLAKAATEFSVEPVRPRQAVAQSPVWGEPSEFESREAEFENSLIEAGGCPDGGFPDGSGGSW